MRRRRFGALSSFSFLRSRRAPLISHKSARCRGSWVSTSASLLICKSDIRPLPAIDNLRECPRAMKQNFTVRQGALDGVEAFLSVAQHRSFRKAAAELGVTPSAISQAVRALEARVGAALFIRTTRSVGLTEAGERFLLRAKPAFEELVAASEVARDLGRRPAGLLRLTVPRAVVPILLEPLIASFCQAYPEVEVEIAASADLVDIAAEGFDAGIRLGQFIEADMIAVRLTPSFPLTVVGSPDYLRRRQRPEFIDDLRRHACLRMRRSNGSITPWSFVNGNEAVEVIVSGTFIANDS